MAGTAGRASPSDGRTSQRICPLRLSSGHRRYTRADVDALRQIKDLVFIKGYSLDGARKALAAKKRQKKAVKALI